LIKFFDLGFFVTASKQSIRQTQILLMTLKEEIQRRRTFAIISHPDAGKTTLTEKLLLLVEPFMWQER